MKNYSITGYTLEDTTKNLPGTNALRFESEKCYRGFNTENTFQWGRNNSAAVTRGSTGHANPISAGESKEVVLLHLVQWKCDIGVHR